MQELRKAIYDLPLIFAFHETIENLDGKALPTARLIFSPPHLHLRHIGILCGSFNPLTLAHTKLAEHARDTFALDSVFFSLAKVTINKEQVTGLSLADRLLLLTLYAQQHKQLGVTLANRGLYFEQAQAFRSLFGEQVQLSFLIGMDKLLQIFDPRYYQDRTAALQQLFRSASLIVANRGDMDEQSFTQLFEQPENQPFRSHVQFFTLPAEVTALSATAIRNALSAGNTIHSQVPNETAIFLTETRAFHPPLQYDDEQINTYEVRQQLLSKLYAVRSWAEQQVDFHQLLSLALSASDRGRTLRHTTQKEDFATLVQACPRQPST
ncbi:MAG: hypothetical protein AB7G75_34520 [Candidatus Binatia bacterium]